ncbi:MAG: phosphoenolpyruvate carboxylase, partial [Phenylobacterium sp.]
MPDPLPVDEEAAAVGREARLDARHLCDLLSQAIAYLDGEAAAEAVDRARAAARSGALPKLSPEEAEYLARAFACHALLANLAEEVAGRPVLAEVEATRGEAGALTLARAVTLLREGGAGQAQIEAALAELDVVPVFTGHPTEVRRRALVGRETEITRLMNALGARPPADRERRLADELFREVALLWRTRLNRPEKLAVADEIRNVLSVVRQSILPAAAVLYGDWQDLTDEGEAPIVLRLGSWLGGDRDGHPGVDAAALKLALQSQARIVCDFYAAALRRLWDDLAISSGFTTVPPEVARLGATQHDPSPHRRDEPYRLALEGIFDRLSATSQKLTGRPVAFALGPSQAEPYADGEAFAADLLIVSDALQGAEGERLIGVHLKRMISLARALGFHLLALDLRQNADVHERTLAELLARAGVADDYLGLDEPGRVALLRQELSHERPLRSPWADYSAETTKELAILDEARQVLEQFGEGALSAYVISKAATVSDMLAVLVLMKEAGLARGGPAPSARLRVAPLFETIGDLRRAPEVMREWLTSPIGRSVTAAAGVQEVMVGYSDSNKDGGYIASRLNVAEAARAIAAECRSGGAPLQLFHGRGGSIGRGGGPAAASVLAQPPQVVQHRIRLTEQGEMISRRYGDEAAAAQRMDGLVGAVLLASNRAPAPDHPKLAEGLARLRDAAFEAYRALVYETPGFEDFFWSATPIPEIAELNIGSRPASRTPSRRIEDLR